MKCPKYNVELHEITFSLKRHKACRGKIITFHVDQCFSCNGFWFDADELEKYLEYELQILNSPAIDPVGMQELDTKNWDCPRCNITMGKVRSTSYTEITMDKCPQCAGIWLDSHEIDLLENIDDSFMERFSEMMRGLFN